MICFWSRTIRRGGIVACCLLIAGCAIPRSIDPRRLFEDDTPAAETAGAAEARERAAAETAATRDAAYPTLASVPDRPTPPTARQIRERVLQGLVSDRRNARYTDEIVRGRDTVPAPAAASPQSSVSQPAAVTIGLAAPEKAPPDSAAAPAAAPPVAKVEAPALPAAPAARVQPAAVAAPAAPAARPEPALASRPETVSQPPAPQAPQAAALPPPPETRRLAGAATAFQEMPLATIQFASGSARLNRTDLDILRQAAIVALQESARVKVVGHSSASGRGDPVSRQLANLEASIERANAVAAALVQYGLDPRKVVIEAKSDQEPLYRETAAAGEAGNRRAEIYLLR